MSHHIITLSVISAILLVAPLGPAASEPRLIEATPSVSTGREFGTRAEIMTDFGGGSFPFGQSVRSAEFGVVFDLDDRFWIEAHQGKSWSWGEDKWQRRLSAGSMLVTSDRLPSGEISLDIRAEPGGGGLDPGAAFWARITAFDAIDGDRIIEVDAHSPTEPAGNSIAIYAYSPGSGTGAFLSTALNGTTQNTAALGLVYDASGFALLGLAGDDSIQRRLRLSDQTTSRKRSLYIGYRAGTVSDWAFSTRLGINRTNSDRKIRQEARFALAANAAAGASGLPAISYSVTESIRWTYTSASIGGTATRDLGSGWSVSLSFDVGAGPMRGTYNAVSRLEIEGLAGQSYRSAPQSFSRNVAHGRLGIGISRALARNTVATLEAWASGMSAVPHPVNARRSQPVSSAGQGTAQLNAAGNMRGHRRIDWRPALATGVRFSVRHQF